MDEKNRFMWDSFELVKAFSLLMEKCSVVNKAYFDQGFNVGGADPITDDDINTAGYFSFSAAEFGSLMTLLEQQDKLLTNVAVTPADYSATINKIRYGQKRS